MPSSVYLYFCYATFIDEFVLYVSAKPIDLLAQYVDPDGDDDLSVEMQEPYNVLKVCTKTCCYKLYEHLDLEFESPVSFASTHGRVDSFLWLSALRLLITIFRS